MAKMFYTLDETRAALGKNEEEIKQLTREGRLREYRDGARLMFKADQVDSLRAEMGAGADTADQVSLNPAEDAPLGLVDSRSDTGTADGISLVDTGASQDGGSEVGLAGSVGGSSIGGRGGASGTRSGINILGDTGAGVDPSAATSVNAGSEPASMEGSGSGAGLLDLQRESDDTSIGAVLNEIGPGGKEGLAAAAAVAPVAARRAGGPIFVEAPDKMAPAFGGLALAGVFILLFGVVVAASAVLGGRPPLLTALRTVEWYLLVGGGVVAAFVFFIVGLVLGRAAR